MELTLTASETREMAARPIDDARAYDCYLQARNQIMTWSEEGLNRANAKLQLGLSMVGDNSLLFAGMGYLQYQYANLGLRQDDAITKAEEYVHKALELDPDLPQAHLVAGLMCQAFLGQQRDAIRHLKRVLAVAPNDTDALLWLTIGGALYGFPDQCVPLVQKLETIDPFNALTLMSRAMCQFCAGDFQQAIGSIERSYELEASSVASFLYTIALLYAGRTEEAMRRRPQFQESELHLDRIAMMFLHSCEGRTADALTMVNDGLVSTAQRDPQWSWHLAAAYASNGEYEKSLNWLENSVQRGFSNYRMIGEHDPYLTRMQGTPRFEAIKNRARQDWETLQKEF
jgi:tetratricopeptide (TPR) repeat protein